METLLTLPLADEAATRALGARLAGLLRAGDVLALAGDLGAGKTTLARGLIQAALGREEAVPSPTFTLVQTYERPNAPTLWHFDLYRLTGPEELVELGWEDALAGGIALVEWPARAGDALPAAALRLTLEEDGSARRAVLSGADEWPARLASLASRMAAMADFLRLHGFAAAAVAAPSADASFRAYRRLSGGPYPALLMDAPPDKEPLRPFVAVAAHLRALGLSAPAVPAYDLAQGFALVEDFGEATFTRLLDDGTDPARLYRAAVAALLALQRHPQNASLDLPAYDVPLLLSEAELFLDWYWPAVKGSAPADDVREAFEAIVVRLLAPFEADGRVLVLRDFHVDNLMLLPGREGEQAVGLLDFQDAVLGHLAYDLASLLQDARRDVSPALEAAMLSQYAAAMGDRFDSRAYYTLAAQRHLKVLGIFTRLSRRDGKHVYLRHTPRLWRLLDHCLAAEPMLAPLAEWLATHFPPEARLIPEIPGEARQ